MPRWAGLLNGELPVKSAKAAGKAPVPVDDAITPVSNEASAMVAGSASGLPSASAALQTTTGLDPAPKPGRLSQVSQVSRRLRTALDKARNASTVQAPFGTLVRTKDEPATPDVRGPAPAPLQGSIPPVPAMDVSRLSRLDARLDHLAHKLIGDSAAPPLDVLYVALVNGNPVKVSGHRPIAGETALGQRS